MRNNLRIRVRVGPYSNCSVLLSGIPVTEDSQTSLVAKRTMEENRPQFCCAISKPFDSIAGHVLVGQDHRALTLLPAIFAHIIDIRGIGNAEDYGVTIRVSLLRIFPHNKNSSMTASCTGSEARAINARAEGEAECEASHKIRITITAILHDTHFSPGTPGMRATRGRL